MAFKYETTLHGTPFLEREFVVENGHTIQHGDLVSFAAGNGTVRRMHTNDTQVVGLCTSAGTHVGTPTGTVLVRVLIDPTGVLRTPRAGLALMVMVPGASVDVNGSGSGIVALLNGDFVIWDYDPVKDDVLVQVSHPAFI